MQRSYLVPRRKRLYNKNMKKTLTLLGFQIIYSKSPLEDLRDVLNEKNINPQLSILQTQQNQSQITQQIQSFLKKLNANTVDMNVFFNKRELLTTILNLSISNDRKIDLINELNQIRQAIYKYKLREKQITLLKNQNNNNPQTTHSILQAPSFIEKLSKALQNLSYLHGDINNTSFSDSTPPTAQEMIRINAFRQRNDPISLKRQQIQLLTSDDSLTERIENLLRSLYNAHIHPTLLIKESETSKNTTDTTDIAEKEAYSYAQYLYEINQNNRYPILAPNLTTIHNKQTQNLILSPSIPKKTGILFPHDEAQQITINLFDQMAEDFILEKLNTNNLDEIYKTLLKIEPFNPYYITKQCPSNNTQINTQLYDLKDQLEKENLELRKNLQNNHQPKQGYLNTVLLLTGSACIIISIYIYNHHISNKKVDAL